MRFLTVLFFIVRSACNLLPEFTSLLEDAAMTDLTNAARYLALAGGKNLFILLGIVVVLVLAVFDLSQPLTDEDYALADRIRALGKAAQTVAVFNKLDLAAQAAPPALFETQVCLSARTGAGREALENAVGALYGGLEPDMDSVVTSARQAAALRRASEALDGALRALGDGAPDASGTELDAAIAALGELDGRSVSEAVVAEIFSRFCVGK